MTLLLNLIIVFSLIAIVWAIRYIIKHPECVIMDEPQESEVVTRMVGDFWNMRQEIARATSSTELESWYWEVEQFESCYLNLISGKLLKDRVQQLYDAITSRRDELKNISSRKQSQRPMSMGGF